MLQYCRSASKYITSVGCLFHSNALKTMHEFTVHEGQCPVPKVSPDHSLMPGLCLCQNGTSTSVKRNVMLGSFRVAIYSTLQPLWLWLNLCFFNVMTATRSDSFPARRPDTTEAPSSWWRISWEWRAGVSSFSCPTCIIKCCSTGRESNGWTGKVGQHFIGLSLSDSSHCCDLSLLKDDCS